LLLLRPSAHSWSAVFPSRTAPPSRSRADHVGIRDGGRGRNPGCAPAVVTVPATSKRSLTRRNAVERSAIHARSELPRGGGGRSTRLRLEDFVERVELGISAATRPSSSSVSVVGVSVPERNALPSRPRFDSSCAQCRPSCLDPLPGVRLATRLATQLLARVDRDLDAAVLRPPRIRVVGRHRLALPASLVWTWVRAPWFSM